MTSWMIDPSKRDYVMQDGAPVPTDRLLEPAYIRLTARRGGWLYAPDAKWGSDYNQVKRVPRNGETQQVENIGERALQPIVDDGRAISADVSINTDTPMSRNNLALDVTLVDAEGEEQKLGLPAIAIGGES